MKTILIFALISLPLFARDVTEEYFRKYEEGGLSTEQVETLKNVEVVLIPGHMSETFVSDDPRSHINLSFFTKDYFGTHLSYLKRLGIPARRLNASSASVGDTKNEIDGVFNSTQRQLVFYTHSLGGMALLDYLLTHPEKWERVSGLIFMQSPFTGAPVATVARRYPKLGVIFPFVHTSVEVVHYLSLEERQEYILKNQALLTELTSKIKTVTVGGIANGYKTVFATSVTLIKSGCLKLVRGRCIGRPLFEGPYDFSDGMVPFEGSKLPEADFVKLMATDHGETVLNTPFRNVDHKRMTAALLKLIL